MQENRDVHTARARVHPKRFDGDIKPDLVSELEAIGNRLLGAEDAHRFSVQIVVLIEPVPGFANCPSNPWYSTTFDLGEPLGDRVLIDPVDRVGSGGLVGEVSHGGLAQYCGVAAHHLVPIPDSISYEQAACLPVAYGTALRMMYTIGDIQAGDKVMILGASGGVGTCAVQLAKRRGCEVIACASSQSSTS